MSPDSPAINAGDPDFVPFTEETDLDGHARILCGRVDIGAYEFGIGDYDCNRTVDLGDFAGGGRVHDRAWCSRREPSCRFRSTL